MAAWKTDPLIHLVLDEIGALWRELPTPERPVLFRIEQCTWTQSHSLTSAGRLVNIWLFDDYGLRLAPILRREPHDFGELRSGYNRYGLVRFEISADRSLVALAFRVGPAIGGEIVYEVKCDRDEITLQALSDNLAV